MIFSNNAYCILSRCKEREGTRTHETQRVLEGVLLGEEEITYLTCLGWPLRGKRSNLFSILSEWCKKKKKKAESRKR